MTTPKMERTKEEIDATVKKLEAETRKLDAEADRAVSLASEAVLHLEKVKANTNAWRAHDCFHRSYAFNKAVDYGSVELCVSQLTEWSRYDKLAGVAPQPMEIVFMSPGGSIFDGFYLFDVIQDFRRKGHHITTGTYGMAASMAGVLLQAGDTRWCAKSSLVMIHRAAFGAHGKTHDVEDQLKLVKMLEDRILNIFVERSEGKLTRQKITRNWDRRDWWITADKAIECGLVDEVRGGMV